MVWNKNDPVLGFLLHDVSRMLRKRFDRRARDLGLTKSQWIVLAHLARHEGIHQSGLADILEIEPITLARHLDRLEDTGWVERQRDPNDRRAWNLHMTEKAGPILDELAVIVDETMEEALTGLPELDRTNLFDMLQAVRANLSERELEPNVDKKSNGIRAEHLT
ncbi:MAG: MarR family transcriptional regulator [Gammaproteobacteria bacterium]|nr:MarR family transcriptional regulator [Gammaproteobacteria bacterium]